MDEDDVVNLLPFSLTFHHNRIEYVEIVGEERVSKTIPFIPLLYPLFSKSMRNVFSAPGLVSDACDSIPRGFTTYIGEEV